GGAYRVFLLNGFLALITLYVMAPFMHQRLKAWQHDNTYFGQTRCSFHARAGQFYLVYLILLAGAVAFFVLLSLSGIFSMLAAVSQAQKTGGHPDMRGMVQALVILYGGLILLGVSIGPAFHALIQNLIWNNTRVGEHRIECNMAVG